MMSSRRGAARAGALLIVLAAWGCESTERIAPDGATIELNASPAQIKLDATGKQEGDVNLLATVRSGIGVPLPGQHVRFTTTSGFLVPTAGTPVETDDDGNAPSILKGTEQNATITATSGKAMDMLTLTASTCLVATLTLESTSGLDLLKCTVPDTMFDLKARARDSKGNGCAGAVIQFEITSTGATSLMADFFPESSDVTETEPEEEKGSATTRLDIDPNDCQSKCTPDKTCILEVRAKVIGGTVTSTAISIVDRVD